MAQVLPFTAPATARPTIAPQPQTRSALMAHLLEQSTPDDMIARPPHSIGEGFARTAGMGLDALMAKKVIGAKQADEERKRGITADLLQGINPELADAFRAGAPVGDIANQVLANKFTPAKPTVLIEDKYDEATGRETKGISYDGGVTWQPFGGTKAPDAGDKPTPYTDLGKIAADEEAGIITAEQAEAARGGLNTPDPVSNTNIITTRKEYENQPGTSRYRLSQPMLASMMANTDTASAMSDFDFIYGMGKIYDPSSTILMGEAGMVLQGQSIPEQVKGYLDKALQGKASLGPEARRDLVNAAMVRVNEYRKQAEKEAEAYRQIAVGMNANPDMIVRPLEDLPAWPKVPLAPVPAAPDAGPDPEQLLLIEDELRRRKAIP